MRLRKDILLFYLLVLVSVGVLIAADPAVRKGLPGKTEARDFVLPMRVSSPMPMNTLTEGILHVNA